MGKRELVALLSLSSWCLVIVVWLFLMVRWVCLQFVMVVFPDHTHYFKRQTHYNMTSCAIMYSLIVHNMTINQGLHCLLNKFDLQKKEII